VVALLARADFAQRLSVDANGLSIDEVLQVEAVVAHFLLSYTRRFVINSASCHCFRPPRSPIPQGALARAYA
jgi:hypothetical protein